MNGNKRENIVPGSKVLVVQKLGKTFTLKPLYRKSTNPNVIRRQKDAQPRQMYCTDIEIDAGVPEKAFVEAWNRVVDNKGMLLQRDDGEDVLQSYRRAELMRLIDECGHIETMQYELMLKVLDHIEIGYEGSIAVYFLTRTN